MNAEEEILSQAKIAYESNTENLRLFDKYIQLLIKYNDLPKAEALISSSSILKKGCVESSLIHAHLLYKMKKYEQSDLMFDELIIKFSENIKLRMLYAQTLKKRRKLIKAYEIIKPLDAARLDKKQRDIYDEIIQIISAVEQKEQRALDDKDDFAILSMKHAILHFKESKGIISDTRDTVDNSLLEGQRPATCSRDPELRTLYTHQDRAGSREQVAGRRYNCQPTLGKVSLVTGTLGPGGAERQLCVTAININEKMRTKEQVSGINISKEVDVLINVYDREDKGFFLPFLTENKVNLIQIKDLPSTPIENLGITSPTLFNLLNECPSSIRYGLNRLVDYFRNAKTEVAFAWQDGAILFTALAALIAEVPKIILNLRGYPPNLRPHIYKPEYFTFYKSLAELSEISFVTNTHATANAYAEWLNISSKKFTVIYNGIQPPPVNPEPHEEASWNHFDQLTSDATETIGGVFRFETDKRPILVIRFIKRYLQKQPHARFILVGGGRLRQQCMDLAATLGISQRILFIGLSKSVGYWMLKMEAMILMSLYEGLPNVLIEAQYMGIPVVSTPAGGAKECFIEGETGCILNDLSEPDLYEACDKVLMLINQFKKNSELKNKATRFAASNFSIFGMLENTVNTLTKASIQMEPLVCEELV
jgi:glycosyltransferase involved in cell wall biosynthesis